MKNLILKLDCPACAEPNQFNGPKPSALTEKVCFFKCINCESGGRIRISKVRGEGQVTYKFITFAISKAGKDAYDILNPKQETNAELTAEKGVENATT